MPSSPPEASQPDRRENPVFNLVDVLLVVLAAVAAFAFCSTIAALVVLARHSFRSTEIKNLDPTALVLIGLPVQVATYILTVGFMVLLIWVRYGTSFLEAVRWNMPKAKYALGALAGGAGLAFASQIASIPLQRWIPKSLPIDQYFRTPTAAYALAAFGILVAPIVEELFFRGFVYPALARPLGAGLATALTAASFALIHAEQLAHAWVPLLLLFVVGTVLTVVRAKTESVAVTVLMHMGYNATLFTGLFIATQGFHHMERA